MVPENNLMVPERTKKVLASCGGAREHSGDARQNAGDDGVNSNGSRPRSGRRRRLPLLPTPDEVVVYKSGAHVQGLIFLAVEKDEITLAPTHLVGAYITNATGTSGSIITCLPTPCPIPEFLEFVRAYPSHNLSPPMPPSLSQITPVQIPIPM